MEVNKGVGEVLKDFIFWFYDIFMSPIFEIMRDTDVLGFPLLNWLFGFTVISLAVRFLRRFLGYSDDGK